MRLGIRDKRVLAAFVRGEPKDGHKLWTDGLRLDGYWIGGRGIAQRNVLTGYIAISDLGSRAAQTVQQALTRLVPRGDIGWAKLPLPAARSRNHRGG